MPRAISIGWLTSRAIPGQCQAAISQNTSAQRPGTRTRRPRRFASVKLFCGGSLGFLSVNSLDPKVGALRSFITCFRLGIDAPGFRVALPRDGLSTRRAKGKDSSSLRSLGMTKLSFRSHSGAQGKLREKSFLDSLLCFLSVHE